MILLTLNSQIFAVCDFCNKVCQLSQMPDGPKDWWYKSHGYCPPCAKRLARQAIKSGLIPMRASALGLADAFPRSLAP